MRSIERLPEAIHSSVRSGVLICDLTRIVEELVFNSLDAGATKVSVSVGVGSCYVKVVDNGSGITRDGLVLLGERYATSKADHLVLLESGIENFHSHGEALCSISDVSLLEIVTKARGKPNGYRKIMKKSKCLFLGINDDRDEVGTTVIVRDIFYNQPVRRKQLQSSPKKVLDSIKMSVLRIALVHVNVSFKVMDVESVDELLNTGPSSSPLSILSSHFGIEKAATFHKLILSDGELKLSGYISDPHEIFSPRAIQYVYMNSRFIYKGPIHRLVNQLAAKFDLLGSWQFVTSSQSEKGNKYDMCPAFILNLHCPRSYYDTITSERSRTSVEFKDWAPILTFIENGLMRLWNKNIYDTFETRKKRFRKPNNQTPLDLRSPQRRKLCKKNDDMPALEDCVYSFEQPSRKVCDLKRYQIEAALLSETDNLSRACDGSLACFKGSREKEIKNHLPPCSISSPVHVACTDAEMEDGVSSSAWGNIVPAYNEKIDSISIVGGVAADCLHSSDIHIYQDQRKSFLRGCSFDEKIDSISTVGGASADCFDSTDIHIDQDLRKSFLRSCSFDEKIDSISTAGGASADCLDSTGIHIDEDQRKSFLRSRSFERSLLDETKPHPRDEICEFGIDDVGIIRRRTDICDIMEDEIDLAICGRDLQSDAAPPFQYSPMTQYDMHATSEIPTRDSIKSSLLLRDTPPDSSKQVWKCTSSWQSFRSGWSPLTTEEIIWFKFLDDDNDAINKNLVKGCSEFGKNTVHGYFSKREDQDLKQSHESTKYSRLRQSCSFTKFCPDSKRVIENTKSSWPQQNCSFMKISPGNKREIGEFCLGDFENMFSPKPFRSFMESGWSRSPLCGEERPKNFSQATLYENSPSEHEGGRPDSRNQTTMLNRKRSSIRSHSAPPFYKGKKRYLNLTSSFTMLSAKSNIKNIYATLCSMEPSNSSHGQVHAEIMNSKSSQNSFGQCHVFPVGRSVMDCSAAKRSGLEITPEIMAVGNGGQQQSGQFSKMDSVDCLNLNEIQDSLDSGWKWRNCCLPTACESRPGIKYNQDIVLDISSDMLQLDGDSLVPKSIERACLEDAKVLNQVDKKFIAVVAGKTLAMVDQHAADERIRLEELRHKVLSGEMKTITYLDAEHELVLPEIGYQLLHNYADQVQAWGWICNIRSQDTNSFSKYLDSLHRQPTIVKLLAVPCILGVNLNDIDLLEFLQQLADTDGSSTIPPSVLSVLNNKACRGAIMFGDTLLPSECSLIVEELKRTSLCFQCAHGRPTTVPLVDLDLLRSKIGRLSSDNSWHGLRQHKLSLKRSSQRLSSALS